MNQMETRLDKRRYTVSDEGYKVQSGYRQNQASNGLTIVGGYKEYLQDRNGFIYRNSVCRFDQ